MPRKRLLLERKGKLWERSTGQLQHFFWEPAQHAERTGTAHLAEPLSLWVTVDGKRSEASGIISLFLCQIDDDRRRDTIQRLRQCKYDKKVTIVPPHAFLSSQWGVCCGPSDSSLPASSAGCARRGGCPAAPTRCPWSLSQGWAGLCFKGPGKLTVLGKFKNTEFLT